MGFYNIRGRTLMVQFTCSRCGATAIIPYEEQAESTEGNLQCFEPPKGWIEPSSRYVDLLCPECAAAFAAFMKGN